MVSRVDSERAVEAALKRGYTRGYEAAKSQFGPPPAQRRANPPLPFDQLSRNKKLLLAAHTVAFGTTAIQDAAKSMEWARDFLALGMKMLDDTLSEVELVATHPFASVTLTEGGDVQQAPGESLSGAVPEGETPRDTRKEGP